MDVDSTHEEDSFKVLPWNISDKAAPKGMRVVRFDGDYVFIVWFENHAFVRKDVKADGSRKICGSPEALVKLNEVKIFDVFELGGKVYVLDCSGDLAYLRKRSRNTVDYSLKFFEKIRSGACNLLAIPDGFIILLIISGHWYLNLYKMTDDGLELMQSLKLGSLPVEAMNCSCVVTTCEGAELDNALMEALFPNDSTKKKGCITFVGFPSGQTFYFHVPTTQYADAAATMLYVSPDAVVGISMYRDPSSKKYSHIILVQQSGALVIMSGQEKMLKYSALYLPSSVHCISLLDTNSMWVSDGIAVWQSKIVKNNQGDLLLQSRCISVGNIDFLSCLEGQNVALALTSENSLLYLCLTQESGDAACQLTAYAARQEKIIAKSDELAKLQQEIAKEDLEIDAINIARRAELLKDKFSLVVKVHDVLSCTQELHLGASANSLPFNESGHYILEGTIENSSGQEIFSPLWSLQVTFKVGSVSKLHITDLNTTFGRNPLKFQFPLQVSDPCATVSIECHLVAELNLDADSELTNKWVILPVGSAVLDASYFFKPMISGRLKINSKYIPSKVHKMQENLQKIADEMGVGVEARLLTERPRTYQLNSQMECAYVLRLPDGSKHQSVWSSVTRHCLHRCEKALRSRIKRTNGFCDIDLGPDEILAIDILIGSKSVKLTLDTECTKLEISCCDVMLLHSVKISLISLLHISDIADVDTSLQTQVEKFRTEFECDESETPNVFALRNTWREITAQLPL